MCEKSWKRIYKKSCVPSKRKLRLEPDSAAMKYQQVYVIGDIGGQRAVFEESLRRIGLDPEQPHLPAGTALIQLGDIGRIPEGELDSQGCIELADRLMVYNPRSYYQLLGNHDWAMIHPEAPLARHWPKERPVLSETMQRWWTEGRIQLALALRHDQREVILTHAGVTAGVWKAACKWAELGHLPEMSVPALAAHLNSHVGEDRPRFLHPGELVTGTFDSQADVLWATQRELIDPWLQAGTMPFNQIHGHESPYNWRSGIWLVEAEARERTLLVPGERWAVTSIPREGGGNSTLLSLDWQLGDEVHAAGYGIYSIANAEITC